MLSRLRGHCGASSFVRAFATGSDAATGEETHMKLLIEVLLAVFLHPIALVLMLINLIARNDLSTPKKIAWAVVGLVWGVGPVLYLVVGDGTFW